MANFMDFQLGGFKIGSIDSSSGVFVGQNMQYGWRQSNKQNSASANVAGDYNTTTDAINQVQDPDMLDTWIQKPYPWNDVTTVPHPQTLRVMQQRKKAQKRVARLRPDITSAQFDDDYFRNNS